MFCRQTLIVFVLAIPALVSAQQPPRMEPPRTPSSKLFFLKSACFRFESLQPGATIRYTENGDEPDERSAPYTGPVCVTGTAMIKAKSFGPGYIASETISVKCIKASDAIRLIAGTEPREPHNKGGLSVMTDRLPGSSSREEGWLGFRDDTVTWKIRFFKKQKFTKIHISLMQAQDSGIFYPVKMELASLKGKVLGLGFFNALTGPAADEERVFSFPLQRKLRGVIIRIQNYSGIPDWHSARGNKPWLFADEVAVE